MSFIFNSHRSALTYGLWWLSHRKSLFFLNKKIQVETYEASSIAKPSLNKTQRKKKQHNFKQPINKTSIVNVKFHTPVEAKKRY
jgi:hypothetical protein